MRFLFTLATFNLARAVKTPEQLPVPRRRKVLTSINRSGENKLKIKSRINIDKVKQRVAFD